MSAKTVLRGGLADVLFLTGVTAPRRRSDGQFTVVTFHRVLNEEQRQRYPYPGLVVTPQELEAIITFLTEHFDCGTLAVQHERYLRHERTERPLLALTFDDAQHDNHRNARPVLARHRVKASFFAPVAAIDREEPLWHDRLGFAILALAEQPHNGQKRLMQVLNAAGLHARGPLALTQNVVIESKRLSLDDRLRLIDALTDASGGVRPPEFARTMTFEELAELAGDGHEIGSHSMTHCMMPECDDRALNYELAESRRMLQERLKQPIESFCYPNGDSDARTAYAVAKAGYLRAVTTRWGHNLRETDRFQLHRYDMDAARLNNSNGRISPGLLAFRVSGIYGGRSR
jgi:peptidoglycan/xylan/chitin deacetylase (PgdA/CDA1 family)